MTALGAVAYLGRGTWRHLPRVPLEGGACHELPLFLPMVHFRPTANGAFLHMFQGPSKNVCRKNAESFRIPETEALQMCNTK